MDGTFRGWTDAVTNPTNTYYTDYGTSNTGSSSAGGSNFKLIHLLDGSGRNSTWYHSASPSKTATNSSLFTTGDKIEINGWNNYLFRTGSFNDGSPIGYSVEIGEMTSEGVEIKIRK